MRIAYFLSLTIAALALTAGAILLYIHLTVTSPGMIMVLYLPAFGIGFGASLVGLLLGYLAHRRGSAPTASMSALNVAMALAALAGLVYGYAS